MKIIQTKLKDMPSSLLAELGSYRYRLFAREEGWSITSRISTPGQEYDRFDCSEVCWFIAWHAQHGICGCARLMPWCCPENAEISEDERQYLENCTAWEISRFSARQEIDNELPLKILWHAVQVAEQSGAGHLFGSTTPMLGTLFDDYRVNYKKLPSGIIQSENNLLSVNIPVSQPQLATRFHDSRCFKPEEVLPSLGMSVDWNV